MIYYCVCTELVPNKAAIATTVPNRFTVPEYHTFRSPYSSGMILRKECNHSCTTAISTPLMTISPLITCNTTFRVLMLHRCPSRCAHRDLTSIRRCLLAMGRTSRRKRLSLRLMIESVRIEARTTLITTLDLDRLLQLHPAALTPFPIGILRQSLRISFLNDGLTKSVRAAERRLHVWPASSVCEDIVYEHLFLRFKLQLCAVRIALMGCHETHHAFLAQVLVAQLESLIVQGMNGWISKHVANAL